MDAKDLRTESGVSERNNDGSKYSQSSGIALHCDRNKSYQDIGSNSLGKVEVQNARPCAVIGPDRVVPPPAVSDAYHIKKGPAEPWPCMDNTYRRLPEYPHKLTSFQNPTRNISPRQTFQENMQRIMVPPTYNSIKINDDTNYAQISDRNNSVPKNIKLNMPPEAKFCDVPYAVNPTNNELKNVRNSEMCLPSVNPTVTRTAPHGWPTGSVNLRSTRMYSAPELYQYQEYPSCAGPRPVVPRPHRTVPEEQGYVYADPYYQEGNIRFKPYPSVKERYPQQRYEYIGNYSNPFHPPPGFPAHKYELQKSIAPHPYPPYPPIKYLDSRVAEPHVMEGYQRTPQDSNTSNDTTQTLGTSQEDCGYVSQSSTASVRSIDSGVNRIPNEYLRKYYDNRYGPIVRTSPMMSKSQLNSNNNMSKDKKQIDVRQFLQMWNEGDEEQEENGSKEIIIQTGSSEKTNFNKTNDGMNNQEQLYVLGLVNVPSEELAKYEHIQKVSKLPENIKGYNSIELLNQFEEVIESSNMSNYKTPVSKDYHMAMKVHQKQVTGVIPPRPVSPLDVEAKISQSVIHKEVGCNFEIKPCSPKMLNVEVAAPVQNILAERSIEKVANPVMNKSPMLNGINENIDCNLMKRGDHRMNMNENIRIPSCKMINNTQFSNTNPMDPIKTSYSLQDLESNSGLCLASLPRLDNDIELNFPEVNQQFINANKGDNNILSSSIRDLPTLEVLDPPENQIKNKYDHTNSSRAEIDAAKSPCIIESETEFSKLSKYRKTKINSSEVKEIQIQHNINAIRTDSVIIKNPENIKNYEDNSDISLNCSDKIVTDVQQAPINLTAQENLSTIVKASENIHPIESEKETLLPTEIAIDFSLNKTDNLNNESIETKMDSPGNSPTHVEENYLNTFINREASSDPISLLPEFTEQHDNIVKEDKGDRGCDLSKREGNDNIPITDDEDSKIKEETLTRNNDHKSLVNYLDEKEEKSAVTEHTITDKNESLNLPETELPDSVNLTVLTSDHSTEEIQNDVDTIDTSNVSSKEADYMFPEIHSEYTENLTEKSNEIYQLNTQDNSTAKNENDEMMENSENHNLIDELSNPIPNKTELNLDTSQNNEFNEISDTGTYPEIREKTPFTSPLHQIDNKQCQLNEDLCCDDSENKEQTKEIIAGEVSKDYDIDTDDKIENDNPLQLLDEFSSSSNQEKLNKTNNEEFLDSPTCMKQSDLYDCDQIINEDLELPIPRAFRYFNKELYSPWIQKLLTFSEGNCNNLTPEKDIDCCDDFLYDSMESLNTSTETVVKQDDCDLDMCKSPFKDDEPLFEGDKPLFEDGKQPFEYGNLPFENDNPPLKDDKPPFEDNKPPFEDEKPSFENDKSPFESDRSPFESDKPPFECGKPTFESDKLSFESDKPSFESDKPRFEDDKSPFEDDTPVLEDDKPPFEDDKHAFEDDKPPYEDDKPPFESSNGLSSDKQAFEVNKSPFKDDKQPFEDNKSPFEDNRQPFEDNKSPFEDDKQQFKDNTSPFEDDKQPFEENKSQLEENKSPFEDDMSKPVTEDLDQEIHTDIEMETDNTSVINSPVLDDYIDESVTNQVDLNSQIDCEDNLKMEENSVADEVVTDDEPYLNEELNKNDVTESCIESDIEENTLTDKNVNVSFENQFNSDVDNQCEVVSEVSELDTCNEEEVAYESIPDQCDDQYDDRKQNKTLETTDSENVRFPSNAIPYKKCNRLKRSLSDSALNMYNNEEQSKQENEDNVQFIWPFKRRKVNNVNNEFLAQNLCNIIHNNRRNSVSSFYNEENVSFCILIDNSCIITEEENEDTEKVCYTELSEDCLQNEQNTENLTENISSPQPEHACDYSDSVVADCEEEKTLEESWVEDVGCEETIIDDDVAEDIEICEPSSPKDVSLSDNEESGVFSSSEHTDKVKSIYGDKMCSDDALFVETLYNTPQMDVNKTLYSRETRVSEEYDRYYDNYSLEKMLSESNEPPLSPYVPPYIDKILNSGKLNPKDAPENKNNVSEGTSSPFQNKSNALDIVVDINVDNNQRENRHSIEIFAKTQEDAVHSCESSVDNVFTYNQKDEDAIYTSSSPEVSSTTSEEKNSSILLKITNYKGSRISQINDISSVNKRSSCKFTEEKEYLHSHANFSSNRPLLTKAAQKYIPPLKESIRDLKVKLSLPQHSLMKLKQLKMSKDEPKLNKQNVSTPRIPKKPKPKFEDVLKSIDEMQFKMHKEKTKKPKKSIPKVVIKKNRNGSHYASTSNKDDFNPDLTGKVKRCVDLRPGFIWAHITSVELRLDIYQKDSLLVHVHVMMRRGALPAPARPPDACLPVWLPGGGGGGALSRRLMTDYFTFT
ncbi:unnamed protein product [Spodoptera littoralis]|uniref:Uncharacterized protein n=1 Tax=Spodoptera littoralis TaxID=7109 RepID=A0A9P0I1U1_SPOLI|nr:unnamed protein product [Spodoptera littoralis]CAH1639552.1 unnamed protein product [Spodoptera littoralis]